MRIIPLLIIFSLILTPLRIFAETNNNIIDLTTNPSKVLFHLSNIKPGDSVTRELVISNNGSEDIKYIASCKLLSGSEAFFRKLDLIIKDSMSKTLYEGKLSEFNRMDPRLLENKQNEKLIFYIKVPVELGNAFQGLETEFQFKFYAEGTLGGLLPANGPKLPETGTKVFNLLVSGVFLFLIGMFSYFYQMRKKC
jgi:LPXTG-motif cell wall-anchored protein